MLSPSSKPRKLLEVGRRNWRAFLPSRRPSWTCTYKSETPYSSINSRFDSTETLSAFKYLEEFCFLGEEGSFRLILGPNLTHCKCYWLPSNLSNTNTLNVLHHFLTKDDSSGIPFGFVYHITNAELASTINIGIQSFPTVDLGIHLINSTVGIPCVIHTYVFAPATGKRWSISGV
jgi:hypothetical protein